MAFTLQEIDAELKKRGVDPNSLPNQTLSSEPNQPVGLNQGKINTSTISSREPTWGEKYWEKPLEKIGIQTPLFSLGVFGAPIKKFATGLKTEGPRFAGETIGQMAGTSFGPQGRIVGAGLGRAGGDAFLQLAQQFSDSPNAPKTVKEASLRLLGQGALGAATQGVSEGISAFAKRVGAVLGFKSTPVKPIPDYDELQRLANKAGIKLTPAQRTASRAIDTMETLAENAFAGRGRLRNIKEISQPTGVRKMTEQLLDDVLPKIQRVGQGELGDIYEDAITKGNQSFKKIGGTLYKRVDEITKGTFKKVPITETIISPILDISGNPIQREQTRQILQETGGAFVNLKQIKEIALQIQQERIKAGGVRTDIDGIIDNILSRPSIANFKTASIIRSDFLDFVRNSPSTKTKAVGLANKAESIIDEQMGIAAKKLSPEAYKAWRTANAFWREGKEKFNSKVIRRISRVMLDQTPDKVVDTIFQAKSPEQIKFAMSLADPLTKKRLQYAFLDNLIEKSSQQIPNDISDLRTLIGSNFIDNWDKYGKDALKEIFPQKQSVFGKQISGQDFVKRIRDVARVAKATQGKPSGAGGFLIQLIQAGPLAGVAGGSITAQPGIVKKSIGAAAQISGVTYSLSRLMASPRGSKILTDMMITTPTQENLASLSVRLSRELLRIKNEEQSEDKLLLPTPTTEREFPELKVL